MTLEQMRLMYGLITDAITKLAQGGEDMDKLTEVFLARGGAASIARLKTDHPEALAEIERFEALVADVTPVVNMLKAGLMKPAGIERSVLMERRGDA